MIPEAMIASRGVVIAKDRSTIARIDSISMTNQSGVSPVESLAFSMHAQPGVYALLLGSGVSRGAGIPTGWEVLGDLIRKLIQLRGLEQPDNPTDWYQEAHGTEANFSELLEQLGATPADRKSILRRYFEPTDEESEQGLKQPCLAHKAIAELVAHGYVKVIVTTNFDRLIENALGQVGVEPVVLSTPQQVADAEPLAQMNSCVIKLHGDYLSPESLNTAEELSYYPPATKVLLERIATEFGLVVCGWSADWDKGLREIMTSAIGNHYPTYWHVLGSPSQCAANVITVRSARTVTGDDADRLFDTLRHQVLALEEYNARRHKSEELAIATLKRYLAEDRFRIQLADLIKRETDEPTSRLNAQPLIGITRGPEYGPQIAERILSAEREVGRLMKLFAIGGYWSRSDSISIWSQAIASVGSVNQGGHQDLNLVAVRQYASFLILYAFGLGAIAAGEIDALATVLNTDLPQPFNKRETWIQIIREHVLQIERANLFRQLPDYDQKAFPFSERMHDMLMSVADLLPINRNDFDALYDKLEILISLAVVSRDPYDGSWTVPGRYAYRESERSRFLNEVRRSFDMVGDHSPYVQLGLFGSNAETCKDSINKLESFAVLLQRNAPFRTY